MPANLRKVNKINAENVSKFIEYNYRTGNIIWKPRAELGKSWNDKYAGKVAGTLHTEGYIVVRCLGERYRAHRLAWLYMTGEWPSYEIDHINGNRADNRFCNLREAESGHNHQNIAKQKRRTTSRFIGVSFRKSDGAWVAQIKCKDKLVFIGAYASQRSARDAYHAAKERLHLFQPKIRANAEAAQ